MSLSDLELIDNVKKNRDSNSLMELSARHDGLCHLIYNKYSSYINSSGICIEDVKADKDYIVYQSVLSFNPDKNVKFSSWLGNNIRFQCLNAIKSDGKYIAMEQDVLTKQVESKQTKDTFFAEEAEKNDIDYIFSILKNLKDDRIEKIFRYRYFEEKNLMSWSQIGKKVNLSAQMVINLHRKGLKFLSTKIKSNNFFRQI